MKPPPFEGGIFECCFFEGRCGWDFFGDQHLGAMFCLDLGGLSWNPRSLRYRNAIVLGFGGVYFGMPMAIDRTCRILCPMGLTNQRVILSNTLAI